MVEIVREILKVFSDNNLFNEGVELIGSWCFKLYQKHLGVKSFPLSLLLFCGMPDRHIPPAPIEYYMGIWYI